MINSHKYYKYVLFFFTFINFSLTSNASQLEESVSEERQTNSNSIDQTDFDNLYQLGKKYFEGIEVKKDHLKAANYYYDAALQGHVKAQHDLAWMYEHGYSGMYNYGYDIEKNESNAIYWYEAAASQGCKVSQRDLGKLLNKSYRFSEATYWLRQAAAQNDHEAQLELGIMWTSYTIPRNNMILYDQNAYELFSNSSQQGNLKSQCYQGIMKIMGRGTVKDEQGGSILCRVASDQDCIEAKFCMGVIYLKGIGVGRNQNQEQSITAFKEAGNKNFHLACTALAHLYYKGIGVIKDKEKACLWTRKSMVNADEIDNILNDFYIGIFFG